MTKNELKYRLMNGAINALARLPLRALYLFSDAARLILHRVVKYRVDVVRKNLAMAFPDKSAKELRKIENDFYRHLFDIFVEAAKLAHISDKEARHRIELVNIDVINKALESGRSVVLMLGHYGNWEWVTALTRDLNKDAIACQIYNPLHNKPFNRVMLNLRSRFGSENIPMHKSVRRLLGIHRDGGKFVCGFIADQRPFSPELKHWTDFLGLDTAYVNGGEVIGEKIGAEYVYVEMLPVKRGHYKMTFRKIEPLTDGQENPYTRAYLQMLEESIRRNPSYWLWSHNRWKRKRTLPTPDSATTH